MAGVTQNKQEFLIFILTPSKTKERLAGACLGGGGVRSPLPFFKIQRKVP